MTPQRIQLSRAKGFRLQEASKALNGLPAVKVDRSSRFGNPCLCQRPYSCPHYPEFERFAWEDDEGKVDPLRCCVDVFRHYVETGMSGEPTHTGRLGFALEAERGYPERKRLIEGLASLRGKNLACWCGPTDKCHADVLIELANGPVQA